MPYPAVLKSRSKIIRFVSRSG